MVKLGPDTLTRRRWPKQGPFDFGSMMIYNSQSGASDPKGKELPLMRKKPAHRANEPYEADDLIHQGGTWLAKDSSISAQDIQRLAMLYPGTEKQQELAKGLFMWRGGRAGSNDPLNCKFQGYCLDDFPVYCAGSFLGYLPAPPLQEDTEDLNIVSDDLAARIKQAYQAELEQILAGADEA